MPIKWFVVVAQIINFLILVWLLKRFLYKPILDAIDAQDFNTLKRRPEVSKSRKMQLLAGAVWGKLLGARS